MSHFNVGDRVRLIETASCTTHHVGDVGTITHNDGSGSFPWYLDIDNSKHIHLANTNELELLSTYTDSKQSIINTTIMKVTNLVKRLLDSDTQTLVEAGYINGDLQLTDEGQSELLSLVFMDKKADLVKLAQEKLDAAKK